MNQVWMLLGEATHFNFQLADKNGSDHDRILKSD
jgi:hypothetical protein